MKSSTGLFLISIFFLFTFSGFYNSYTNSNSKLISDIVPCELLTKDQVETVLPGNDGGYTANDGNSLMKGVKSYQCSYSDEEANLFTVIVHVADNKDNFDWVKPNRGTINMMYKNVKDLKIGDGGWLYGEPDDMLLKATKGFTALELELMSPDADKKSDALIKLATSIINKIE